MSFRTLDEKFAGCRNIVEVLRNLPAGHYPIPVPAEHTNWRDEQRAWAESAVLFDQSYHMTDVYLEGPDTTRLLSDISINNYTKFSPMTAMQFVACAENGYMIGDAIAFHLPDGRVNLVGKPSGPNFAAYTAETGDYDVSVTLDKRSLEGGRARTAYRLQVQGPSAMKILERVNGGPIPETRFFGMCEFSIAGHKVTALRHGMAGAPGMELWGPYEEKRAVCAALVEAGREYGMRLGGARTYSTAAPYSGWVGSILPAIYEGDEMRCFREWLSADGFEANHSIGGSFLSDNIEDYYMDPWDTGYHRLIHWDHEFKGRDALLAKKDRSHRRKVWLKWNEQDVLKIFASMFKEKDRFKALEMPAAQYAGCPYDQVLSNDDPIGLSVYAVYVEPVHGWISLGIIEEDQVEYGKEVTIVWGEESGGTGKPTVEPHIQTTIRATISRSAHG